MLIPSFVEIVPLVRKKIFGGDGGHLGHVTRIIYINFGSPFPRMFDIKFGFDWPRGFEEMIFENSGRTLEHWLS